MNIHYVDKEGFFSNNSEFVDNKEEVMVFATSPTYVEVVARVREVLKWMDPREKIELVGRYDVGSGHKTRMKKMPIECELNWGAYKEMVAASQDKYLELFASKVQLDHLHIDLNQSPSPHRVMTPTRNVSHDDAVELNDISQPPLSQQMEFEMDGADQADEQEDYVNGEHGFGYDMEDEEMEDDASERENEFHDTYIGDVEEQVAQDDMDRDMFYKRSYAVDSEDEGAEDLDEDGFTEREAQTFLKLVGRSHRIPFFCDLTLADKAIVDGGKTKDLEATPSTTQDDDANKSRIKEGLKFPNFVEMQMWLCEYAVKHHRPFKVKYSDEKKRYTVICDKPRCPWVVRARPCSDGRWRITSCEAHHMCKKRATNPSTNHRQLTSSFIAYRLQSFLCLVMLFIKI